MPIMTYGWQWTSKQGESRIENRDTCGVFISKTYTFAVVVDASSKGSRGINFNQIWVSGLLNSLPYQLPTVEGVISAMRNAHSLLREARLFTERACYVAILLPHTSVTPTAFICGDCSVGMKSYHDELQWLTPTHTLARFCDNALLEESGVNPNIVTRTLNARRFDAPFVISLPPPNHGDWVLATDGFRDSFQHGLISCVDDSSCLILGENLESNCNTDTQNFFLANNLHKEPATVRD